MKRAYVTALGGMIAALSLVLMFFAVLFPFAQLVLPGAAGILLISAVYEMGEGWAFLIYVAVGILSMLLPTSKDAALYYIFFLGHYPVLKSYLERIKNKYLKWLVKIVIFNVCVGAALLISIKIFGMPDDMFGYGYIATALILNFAFVVYDIAVSRLIVLYCTRLHKIIRKS